MSPVTGIIFFICSSFTCGPWSTSPNGSPTFRAFAFSTVLLCAHRRWIGARARRAVDSMMLPALRANSLDKAQQI